MSPLNNFFNVFFFGYEYWELSLNNQPTKVQEESWRLLSFTRFHNSFHSSFPDIPQKETSTLQDSIVMTFWMTHELSNFVNFKRKLSWFLIHLAKLLKLNLRSKTYRPTFIHQNKFIHDTLIRLSIQKNHFFIRSGGRLALWQIEPLLMSDFVSKGGMFVLLWQFYSRSQIRNRFMLSLWVINNNHLVRLFCLLR